MHPGTCYIAVMRRTAGLIGLLVVELCSLLVLASIGDLRAHVPQFLFIFVIATLAALQAGWLAQRERIPLRVILLVAVILRVPMFLTQPSLSDDVWRYIHDGRAQNAGVSPYRYAPEDPATVHFRGPEFTSINHPHLPTIYPPAAQYAFRIAAWFADPLLAWRLLLLAAELAIICAGALLLRQRRINIANLTLYAWHPLAIIEAIGSAHLEPLAIAALVTALMLVARGAPVRAGAALAASVATKLVAAPLVFIAGNGWRFHAVFLLMLVALYAPFVLEGSNVLGSLGIFAESWESNGSIYVILAPAIGARAYRLLAATVLLLSIWLMRGMRSMDAAFAYFFTLLMLAPVVHPWYLLWLLAALALRDRPLDLFGVAALVWTLTVPFAYIAHQQEVWHVPQVVLLLEYLPVVLILLYSLVTFSMTYLQPSRRKTPANM